MAASAAYTSNGLNQYTDVSGNALSYSANGNLTSDGSWTLGYDIQNRLISASRTVPDTVSMTLSYDPRGRLSYTNPVSTSRPDTRFVYDGDALVLEYNSDGSLRKRYVHGPGVDQPLVEYSGTGLASPLFLHADARGSIIAQANGSGVPTDVYTYGPWGEPDSLTGSRFRYTGQTLLPEIGFYHYKARIYSPWLGRFLQTDPIGYEDQVNLYAYVGNDPVNMSDPSGLEGCGSRIEGVNNCSGVSAIAYEQGRAAAE